MKRVKLSMRLIGLLSVLVLTQSVVLSQEVKTTAPTTSPGYILTPPSPSTPRINGPRLLGVHPGNPVLYRIPATGNRPMKFSADGLPEGLKLDAETGQIAGSLAKAGEYKVKLRATNSQGTSEKEFTFVVGDRIALTPPMGWNTYYAFRLNINDALVRRQADAMVSTGLINHGWTYMNLDEGWANKPGAKDPAISAPARDENGKVNANPKFPDMKALCDYLHANGMKAGIYSSPGPLCCGGFVGSYEHEDQDIKTYADWGFDYVKYDWCFYAALAHAARGEQYAKIFPESATEIKSLLKSKAELEAKRPRTPESQAQAKAVDVKLEVIYSKMDQAKKLQIDRETASAPYRQLASSIAAVKRDMVFSFCQYGMDNVWEWGEQSGGNAWRTTRDIIDDWGRVSGIGFGEAGLEKFAGPGHWNDPDILQVGTMVKNIPSRLTPDEQYAHVSLWCLLSAPLLIGGDLTKMDAFSLNLLTNDEVIAVNQDALGKQASRISQNNGAEVWSKQLEDHSLAIGLFNRSGSEQKIAISWKDLGLLGNQTVRDLWRQKDIGASEDRYEATVPSHGVLLLRVQPSP